jgi:ribosomal protein S18 acetylase RimI-like enzyme
MPDESIELAIEIEWFGVDVHYQGQRTEEGDSIARTLFETVEYRAHAHGLSTPDMPLVLEVDEDNLDAQGFWEHLGFELFEWAQVESDRYLRMIRSASE